MPVYDYVLMTEPLSAAQLDVDRLAATGRAIGDTANQFHYYRLTAGQPHPVGRLRRGLLQRRPDHARRATSGRPPSDKLAEHFFETFPQLDGRPVHATRWGGVIDTCARFCAFFGTAYGGRLSYAVGYTGLGVGATRFGAEVMLDLLAGEPTELTSLEMVRSKPMPFPPEPVRSAVIQLTRWSIARADRNDGRRNLWLRTLDRLGLGFDS